MSLGYSAHFWSILNNRGCGDPGEMGLCSGKERNGSGMERREQWKKNKNELQLLGIYSVVYELNLNKLLSQTVVPDQGSVLPLYCTFRCFFAHTQQC